MSAYVFPEIAVRAGWKRGDLKIEMALETLATHSLSWASPTAATVNPFTDIPSVSALVDAQVGTFGGKNGDFEVSNRVFDGTNRMSDILTAYSPVDYAWHIRLSYKPVGGAYSIIYMGKVQIPDVDITKGKDSDPATWRIQFGSVSNLMQLDEMQVDSAFLSAYLAHATYDFTPTGIWFTWPESGTPHYRQLQSFSMYDGVNNYWLNANTLRFIKLRDVIESVSRAMGFTTAMNQGAAIDCDWVFYTNVGADVACDFEDLYVCSGVYSSSVYIQHLGLFDPAKSSDLSLFGCGSLLEMLKTLIIPFGLVASIQWTAGGDQYLQIEQVTTNTGGALSQPLKGTKVKPAQRLITGLSVNNVGAHGNLVGSAGDGGTAIRNIYLSGNAINHDKDWYYSTISDGHTRDLTLLFGCLYARVGNNIYNVYKVSARAAGQTAAWGEDITYDWDDASGLSASIVGEASARYWFCPYAEATSAVGLYRPIMRRVEIEVPGIDTTYSPRQYITYDGANWWIMDREWDFRAGRTKYTAETGAW